MTQTARDEVRGRILSASRELFLSNGVRGVTMADVARAAGCTRQMLYKVFFDRRELVLAAVVGRVEEIADLTASASTVDTERADSFIESFVDVSVRVVESLRNDPELGVLFGDGSPVTAHDALWTPELTQRALRFWQPWLDAGQRQRVLRDDLSNHDLADWLHTVYTSIILRPNIPPAQERSMIQRFVITSLAMASTTATP